MQETGDPVRTARPGPAHVAPVAPERTGRPTALTRKPYDAATTVVLRGGSGARSARIVDGSAR